MKWLFATTEFPWPLHHGTALRVYHLARTLVAQGDSVAVLAHEGGPAGIAKYAEAGVTVLDGPRGPALRRGRSRRRFAPYAYDPELSAKLLPAAPAYDVVVLVRPNMLQYVPEASAGPCVVADFVDDPVLETRRERTTFLRPLRWARGLKFLACEYAYERQFLSAVRFSFFVSREDAASFQRRHRNARAVWVPNGVDAAYFDGPAGHGNADGGPPIVTFLGNLRHPPNADAAEFLVREIAPRVWARLPAVEFVIAGSDPSDRIKGLAGPRVRVTGWMADVRPILWASTVALLPMRRGTGIKNKVLEAWAAGTAVVTTPLSGQGLPIREGENVLLGRSPGDLARATVRLIHDPALRRALVEQGRQTVRRHLTWDHAADRLRAEIQSIRSERSASCPKGSAANQPI